LGYHHLVHDGYVSCGLPWDVFQLTGGNLGPVTGGPQLPGREGKNAEVAYNWNVHTRPNGVEVVSQNCLTCHAATLNGQLVIGLGNTATDWTRDQSEGLADLELPPWLFTAPVRAELEKFISRVIAIGPSTKMLTVGTNPAEMIAATLVAHRDRSTLEWSDEPLEALPQIPIPSDPPPWWRSRKKNALFHNGMARGDHRGTMMLASTLCTDSVAEAEAIDAYFHHIQAYVRSTQPPPYPYSIDQDLSRQGQDIFQRDCAGCHGTYALDEADEDYPNLLIPLDVIGTDPMVAMAGVNASSLVRWYNESFYGEATRMEPSSPWPGYMAPPLDGIWATAPFLHNGSVPTLDLILNSAERPTFWRRDLDSDSEFDQLRAGWPFLVLAEGRDAALEKDRRWVYDTLKPGHGNRGHTFGDHLSASEREAVVEYLKTL
jgi:mono/diheme cytochrome c family protein